MTALHCLFSFIICWQSFVIVNSSSQTKIMMRAAQFEVGGPEKMTIGQIQIPVLKDKEILIKVVCTAINRADTLQRKGVYPPPAGASDILGLEAAGTVDRIGPGCSQKWSEGARVMALLSGGGNAEYVSVHEDHVIAVPSSMSFEVAAAIPETWLTAFQLLHTLGHIKSGESVLIHAGGSGVGTAAVQLSLMAGARPIVTAGSKAKLDTAIGLGAVTGFNYKEEDFGSKVLEFTGGQGVNVILDCVGGSFWERNAKAIALEGRWMLYGLLGGPSINGDFLRTILGKRVSLTGTTLRARSVQYKSELVQNFTAAAMPHFISGRVRPIIDRVLPLDKIANAHSLMESNLNTGKIVLRVLEEDAHSEL